MQIFHKEHKYEMKWMESNFKEILLLKDEFLPVKLHVNRKHFQTFMLI